MCVKQGEYLLIILELIVTNFISLKSIYFIDCNLLSKVVMYHWLCNGHPILQRGKSS